MVDGNDGNDGNENGIDKKSKAESIDVDIDINLWEDYDIEETTKFLERLFKIADKLGKSLHEEELNVGEAILITYMLERGALDTMKLDNDNMFDALIRDNKQRVDFMANMILRNKLKNKE